MYICSRASYAAGRKEKTSNLAMLAGRRIQVWGVPIPRPSSQIEWCPSQEMEALARRGMCSPLEMVCLLVI